MSETIVIAYVCINMLIATINLVCCYFDLSVLTARSRRQGLGHGISVHIVCESSSDMFTYNTSEHCAVLLQRNLWVHASFLPLEFFYYFVVHSGVVVLTSFLKKGVGMQEVATFSPDGCKFLTKEIMSGQHVVFAHNFSQIWGFSAQIFVFFCKKIVLHV